MFLINPQSKLPLYEQLIEQLRRQIVLGAISPDAPLPSVRQLSVELGINPNTVQKAYQELESEDVIYTVGGKGCFVGSRENAAAANREHAENELREILRQARLAGVDRAAVYALLEQCYGGDKTC